MPYVKVAEWREIQAKLASMKDTPPPPTFIGEDHAGLKSDIAQDAVEVHADVIAQGLLEDVCIAKNCRENAFVMEEGKSVRTQPFRLTDSSYKVVSREMLKRILEETQVDAIKWQAEGYDCEDIARKFVTRCADLGVNSVGRVMSWSGKHAFCIAVVQLGTDIEFVFIEPQTDQIIDAGSGKYDLENALIVIS